MATDIDDNKRYDEHRLYLIRGSTLNGIFDLLRRRKPKAGTGIGIRESKDGTFIDLKQSSNTQVGDDDTTPGEDS